MLAKFPFGGEPSRASRDASKSGAARWRRPNNVQHLRLQRRGLRRAPGRSATRPCRDVSVVPACERALFLRRFPKKRFIKSKVGSPGPKPRWAHFLALHCDFLPQDRRGPTPQLQNIFNSRGASATGHVPCPARPRRSAPPKLGSPGCKPGGLASKPQGVAATTLASLPSRKACQCTGAKHGQPAKHGSHVRVGFLPTGAGLTGRTKAGAARFFGGPHEKRAVGLVAPPLRRRWDALDSNSSVPICLAFVGVLLRHRHL
jgi:hypothetical protein